MNSENLKLALSEHKKFLLDSKAGKRANLSYANLRGADLRGADLSDTDLRGAIGNKKHIKSMRLEKYDIAYTSKMLFIGCEAHSILDWFEFSDETISKMDSNALDWRKKWELVIKNIIELSPCKPTKELEK